MPSCLVVDDTSTIRKIACQFMGELGLTTREAVNGADALEKCREAMPDAVLLDWNMPVMDGLACLTALRAMSVPLQPKVLFCTTENEFSKLTTALEAGADEYIMKPFDKDILEGKLREVGVL